MGKNVLILTGSPRKGGNSDLLADALAKGATAAGHSATKIETASLDIKGCRACDACYSKGEACVFNDDFNKIAPQMLEADVVVFSFPLYWYTFTTQLNPLPAEAGRFLLRLKSQFRLKPVAMRLKPAEATAHRRLCGTHHREAYPGVQCNP